MIDLITLALAALTVALGIMNSRTTRRLHALRRNCFVTNEDDFRVVRYVEASAAVRARAEK